MPGSRAPAHGRPTLAGALQREQEQYRSATRRMEAQLSARVDAGCDTAELITSLEDAELGGQTLSPLLYSAQLLGYYTVDDMPSARFLWKRLPLPCKQNQELCGVWEIGKHLWTRQYPQAFEYIAANSPGFSPLTRKLLNRFAAAHRERSVLLLTKAYTTISTAAAAGLTGVPAADITDTMTRAGWEVQEGMLIAPVCSPCDGAIEDATGMQQLQNLTEYIVHLDS